MKTTLPYSITTRQEAEQFLTELHSNGESYHPEDNAHQIAWAKGAQPTSDECARLNRLMEDIYNLEGNNGDHRNPKFDPCRFLLDLEEGPVRDRIVAGADFTNVLRGEMVIVLEVRKDNMVVLSMAGETFEQPMDEVLATFVVGHYRFE